MQAEIGNCCRHLGSLAFAESFYKKALSLATHQQDWLALLEILPDVARFHEQQKEHEEALALWTRCAHVAEDMADSPQHARALLAMGRCVRHSGDLPRSANYYKRALDAVAADPAHLQTDASHHHHHHQAGDTLSSSSSAEEEERGAIRAEALSLLVDVHSLLEQHRVALDYEQAKLDLLVSRRAHPTAVAFCHVAVGNRQLQLASPRKAVASLQEGLQLARKSEFFGGEPSAAHAEALCQLSYAFQLMQELESSERFA